MTSKLTRKRAVLAKIESSYGTDPTPTGGANAILISNPVITPLSSTLVSRDNVKAYIGQSPQLLANKHVEVTFDVEIAGAGSAGTAPAYGALLRACGLSETISAGVSVVYAPISTGFESVTVYFNVDGIQHIITGARGTVDIDVTAAQIPVFKFSLVGVYNAPTDTALPSTTLTAFQTPLIVNNNNTTNFSFYSVSSLLLKSFTMSVGNTVDFRALVGSESVQIMDRKSTGQAVFEAPTLATLNAFSNAVNTTSGAVSFTHGTTGGNKVLISCPTVTLGTPTYTDDSGVTMITAPLFVNPSSGNDEFTITVE